jgi:GT2 family glycosyltransferase
MEEVCVSIVLYNNDAKELSALLDSIATSSRPINVVVVDNSPTDDLRARVEAYHGTYIWHGRNCGFGGGHNIALKRTLNSSKYHLVVNPDVTFTKGVIECLYQFMEGNPGIGLVMPRILNQDGSEQRLCKLLPSPIDLFLRRFLGPVGKVLFRSRWDQYEIRDLDMNVVREVPSLSGCFMFMRTSVLRETGLFDERYFMYLEDVDLCRRIGRVSQTVFYPHVSVVHGYAKGSYQDARLLKHHISSAMKYFSKWGWFYDREREYLNRKTKILEGEIQPHATHKTIDHFQQRAPEELTSPERFPKRAKIDGVATVRESKHVK